MKLYSSPLSPDALGFSCAPLLHVLLGAVCSWSKGGFLTCFTKTEKGNRE